MMFLTTYFNPYSGVDFFQFFVVFAQRMWLLLSGQLALQELASDEIQLGVLMGIAFSTALVGTFLVLRRMTMLANALSHTILLGIVLAYIATYWITGQATINIPLLLIAAVVTGLLTAFCTEFLHKTVRLQEDASIGLVFTTLFALGIVAVTVLTRNAHVGTEAVMGNVDALQVDDLQFVWLISFLNLLITTLCFKEYQLTTFDAGLAKSLGISPGFFNYLLMIQVSASVIAAFRAVGVLMVIAFLVGPVLAARLLTYRLKTLLLLSIVISVIASFLGVALSRHLLSVAQLPLSTAGLTVCCIILLYGVSVAFSYRDAYIGRYGKKKPL